MARWAWAVVRGMVRVVRWVIIGVLPSSCDGGTRDPVNRVTCRSPLPALKSLGPARAMTDLDCVKHSQLPFELASSCSAISELPVRQ